MTFALKRTETEWLSKVTIGRKITSFWWDKTPAKALLFDQKSAADALCGLVNAYKVEPKHQVVEVPA